MSTRALRTTILSAVAILLPTLAQADIYRSVGSDGVISFSSSGGKGKKKVAADAKPALPSDTSKERYTRYDDAIREAATLYQIPEALIRAVIQVESNYDPRAVSPVGAHGLMQLMPPTAQAMMVEDIFDPRQNILGGTRYLRVLANLFNGDIHLTIAGYNAGENAVIRYGGIPPYRETQDYVVRVLDNYHRYRDQEREAAAQR
jgi:soluble lytic murein transglycosylase-like protein